jgi:ATP-binding cassette, subfamily B, bacterial MsbA
LNQSLANTASRSDPLNNQRPTHKLLWNVPVLLVGFGGSTVLAVISSLLGALIGPSLFLLLQNDGQDFVSVQQLFGENLGRWFAGWGLPSQLSHETVWFYLPWILLLTATIRTVFSIQQNYHWERFAETTARKLRKRLFRSVFGRQGAHVYPSLIAAETLEGLASLVGNDVRIIRDYCARFIGGVFRDGMQTVFYLMTAAVLAPKLTLYFFLFLLPIAVIVSRLAKKLRRRAEKVLRDFSGLAEWIQQRLYGVETIKHLKSEAIEVKRFDSANYGLWHAMERAVRVKARTGPMMEVMGLCGFAAVLYVALVQIQAQELSGPVLISFFGVMALLSQSAGKFAKHVNLLQEQRVAAERLDQSILNLEEGTTLSRPEIEALHKNDEVIGCSDLSVMYPPRQVGGARALTDFEYSFKKARFYCILGPSGSGKSTLFRALLGLVPLERGKIRLPESNYAEVGLVPQGTPLFHGTIAEHIAYPQQDIKQQKVSLLLQKVGLESWLDQAPEGVHTVIGPDGYGMSGGQAQRLFLARVLYHDFKVVLVDEGTSAVDSGTEQLLLEQLRKLVEAGATVITIAHRKAVFEAADEYILLNQGRLVASGAVQSVAANDDVLGHFTGE